MSDDCGADMCCADDGVCDAIDYGSDWADGGDDYVGVSVRREPTIDEQRKKCESLRRDIERMEKEKDDLVELFATTDDIHKKEEHESFLVSFRYAQLDLVVKRKEETVLLQTIAKMEARARFFDNVGAAAMWLFIIATWPLTLNIIECIFTGKWRY